MGNNNPQTQAQADEDYYFTQEWNRLFERQEALKGGTKTPEPPASSEGTKFTPFAPPTDRERGTRLRLARARQQQLNS